MRDRAFVPVFRHSSWAYGVSTRSGDDPPAIDVGSAACPVLKSVGAGTSSSPTSSATAVVIAAAISSAKTIIPMTMIQARVCMGAAVILARAVGLVFSPRDRLTEPSPMRTLCARSEGSTNGQLAAELPR